METDLKHYKFFADYIEKHTGIIYKEKDYYRLDARFKTLLTSFDVSSVDDIYNLFQTSITPEMHQVLIDISTNNETYFLRDTKPFDALVDEVIPDVQKRNQGTLKIWSCACSTGQEVLSILMKICEKDKIKLFPKVEVFASDISSRALEKARQGIYDNLDVQRGLPAPYLVKYFKQTEKDKWKIDQSILSKVHFDKFNLLEGSFKKDQFDIIFCRNVLIYQDHVKKQKILNNLYDSLKDGGYFFMGSGESMIGMKSQFKSVKLSSMLVYQK